MVVYVEAVLFDNFFADLLLAYLTLRLTRQKVNAYAMIISALVGSGFALLSPLVTSCVLIFKFGVLFVNSALFYLQKSFRGYLINTFVYAVLSFCFCGIITFILDGKMAYTFIGLNKGGAVGCVSLAALVLVYIVRQVNGLTTGKKRSVKYAVAEFFLGEKSVRLNALYDSGNLLTDENGESVVVSDENAVSSLGELPSVGEMKVTTASGSKVLKLVKIPRIKIYSEGSENTLINVTVALSKLPKEYAVILPC